MLALPRQGSNSRPYAAVGLAFTLLSVVPVAAQATPGAEKKVRVDRRFTYLDESLHGAQPGEIEFGLSKDVVAAIDLVEWHTTDANGDWTTKYDGTGGELRFRLADPREGI